MAAITPASIDQRHVAEIDARVRRAVRWACPRWLAGQEEDLAQQASLRVLKRLDAGQTLNTSYIKMVAHSVIVDEIRQQRTRRTDPAGPDDLAVLPAGDAQDPLDAVASGEVGRAIRLCLEVVAEARRRAVTLHLLGHSVAEAARLLGFEFKKTENLVYRGLSDLRQCLAGRGVTP